MKRGMTTANAIVLAVIIIGSVFIVSLFGELGGEDITGDVVIKRVSRIGGFCGDKQVKVWKGYRTYSYTCPSGSSCVNSRCVKVPVFIGPPIPVESTEEVPKETTQVPAGAVLILGEKTDELIKLKIGDTIGVEGKNVTLANVASTGAIIIVDEFKEFILAKQTETVNGLIVTNKEPFYTTVVPPPSTVSCTREAIGRPWKDDVISGDYVCKSVGKKCSIAALLIMGVDGDRYLTLRGCSEIQYIPNNDMLGWVEAICC